jgi:lysophospholipase L1-like esterase
LTEPTDNPALPRVLLIGDSISQGYAPTVRALLAGIANVHRVPRGGYSTGYSLEHLEEWLAMGPWNLIHFNWGLHDVVYMDAEGNRVDPDQGTHQVSAEAYEASLIEMVARMEPTGAKLIWASTTPIPEGAAARLPGDEVAYNAIAARVMEAHGIPINDLRSFIAPHIDSVQRPADVHFKPEGQEMLGQRVADAIRRELSSESTQRMQQCIDMAPGSDDPTPRQRWEAMLPQPLKENHTDAFAFVKSDPDLPRVLLIGDSISIGYTPTVRELLAGIANVHRVPRNAASTALTLQFVDEWLGDGPWDLIHFNWGLHDVVYMDADGTRVEAGQGAHQVPADAYAANLNELVSRLKATGAMLIWASTTPIPDGADHRLPGEEVDYNAIASRVMGEQGVAINDLHAFIAPHIESAQQPANVHYTPEGYVVLGQRVAEVIREGLRT